VGRIGRVEVVANLASGGVDKQAPEELEKVFAAHGLAVHVCAPETHDLTNCLRAAVDAGPDLLVTLAGDGTARMAAELCGPKGPLLAPLPGGTMNMLPRALYGARSWQEALNLVLEEGSERMIGGGEVDGRPFLVAAVLGSPALWAPAREAARFREPRLGFNALVRDWRDDPAVQVHFCRRAQAWAASGIPALLDGELVRVGAAAQVTYRPAVARMLALPKAV
jgi:diacylglycerol kinase family enzyme